MSHEDEPTMTEGRTLSRRTVVRTAAHAAWAVPAISLITAAPALAASGDTLSFATPIETTGNKQVTITTSVTNTTTHGTTIAANGLVVVVDFTGTTITPKTIATTPAGWTGSISGLQVTFTHTAAIAANATTAFAPVINTSAAVALGKSIGLTATASGYTNGIGSVTTH